MDPITIALMGGGLLLQAYGNYQANLSQADAARKNAGFYREQAQFAKEAGERQQMIFDRETQIQYGEQLSAYAKAGVDTQSSSLFFAKQMLFRQQESFAIKKEADMNVRLALLRADQAATQADTLEDPTLNMIQAAGPLLMFAGKAGLGAGGSTPNSGGGASGNYAGSFGDNDAALYGWSPGFKNA